MVTSNSTAASRPLAAQASTKVRPGDISLLRAATTSAMVRFVPSTRCTATSSRSRCSGPGAGRLAGDDHSPAELAVVDGDLDLLAGGGEGEHPLTGRVLRGRLRALLRRLPQDAVGLLEMVPEVASQEDLEACHLQGSLISNQRVAAVPAHPVVDVLAGTLADRLLGLEEVGEGEEAAGPENAKDLGVAALLVRD